MYNQRKVALIIEDSPTQATETSALLEDAGLNVLCAVNGLTGIRLATQIHPDVIILDVNMPDLNGYEVCARLRGDSETRDIPIIILSRQPKNAAHTDDSIEFIPKDAFAFCVLIETVRQMGLLPDNDYQLTNRFAMAGF